MNDNNKKVESIKAVNNVNPLNNAQPKQMPATSPVPNATKMPATPSNQTQATPISNANNNQAPKAVAPVNNNAPLQTNNTVSQVKNQTQPSGVINKPTYVNQNIGSETHEEVVPVTPVKQEEVTQTVITPNNNIVAPSLEVNTDKEKGNNNMLFFVVIIALVVCVFFMDRIVDYFTEDNYNFTHGIVEESSSNNLIDGFIRVGENNSFMKLEKIKFYNFKQSTINVISFDYVSDKNISNVENKKIFIELYDSNKDLIYKEQFIPDNKVENGVVSKYSLYVTSDVYSKVFYSKAIIYSKQEESSTQELLCTSTVKNTNINVTYKNTFHFVNNSLVSYDVSMSYTSPTENAEVEKYKAEIKEEYLRITNYNITSNYKDDLLTYSIDLSNYPEGYKPLYAMNTVSKIISNKETLKKWKCE